MIAKELEGLDELEHFSTTRSDDEEPEVKKDKKLVFPIKERYLYRYNKITLRGEEFLAKKSCRSCHGTGKVGLVRDPKSDTKYIVYCTCLTKKEELKDAA